MREKLNCPNCGAPISGAVCEYCGTLFYDFANIELGKPGYLRMKIGENLNIFKAVTEHIRVEDIGESSTFYFDGSPVEIAISPDYRVTLELRIIPDDEGILITRLNEKFRRK